MHAWFLQECTLKTRRMAALFKVGSLQPPQEVSEFAGPHGGRFLSHSTGPAPHAIPQALVEACVPPCECRMIQGDPWLCQSLGPIEISLLLPRQSYIGLSFQGENAHASKMGWGAMCIARIHHAGPEMAFMPSLLQPYLRRSLVKFGKKHVQFFWLHHIGIMPR